MNAHYTGTPILERRDGLWREVERLHKAHPDWAAPLIARELGCLAAYVRKTAARRGWKLGYNRSVTLPSPKAPAPEFRLTAPLTREEQRLKARAFHGPWPGSAAQPLSEKQQRKIARNRRIVQTGAVD
jgi:hypothetical protein